MSNNIYEKYIYDTTLGNLFGMLFGAVCQCFGSWYIGTVSINQLLPYLIVLIFTSCNTKDEPTIPNKWPETVKWRDAVNDESETIQFDNLTNLTDTAPFIEASYKEDVYIHDKPERNNPKKILCTSKDVRKASLWKNRASKVKQVLSCKDNFNTIN